VSKYESKSIYLFIFLSTVFINCYVLFVFKSPSAFLPVLVWLWQVQICSDQMSHVINLFPLVLIFKDLLTSRMLNKMQIRLYVINNLEGTVNVIKYNPQFKRVAFWIIVTFFILKSVKSVIFFHYLYCTKPGLFLNRNHNWKLLIFKDYRVLLRISHATLKLKDPLKAHLKSQEVRTEKLYTSTR